MADDFMLFDRITTQNCHIIYFVTCRWLLGNRDLAKIYRHWVCNTCTAENGVITCLRNSLIHYMELSKKSRPTTSAICVPTKQLNDIC